MSDERQHVKEEESKLTHETDEGDDVEAHNKLAGSKLAGSKGSVARNDEGDDDVTAHVKANPN